MNSFALSGYSFFSTTQSSGLPTRNEIEEKFKWNLSDIYLNNEEWEKDFDLVKLNIPKYSNYEGKLGSDLTLLKRCLLLDEETGIKLERLYLYSMLSKDSDLRVELYLGMDNRVKSLFADVSAASAFIKPELLEIEEDVLRALIKEEQFTHYSHFIDELLRQKPHTLNKGEEKILAMGSEINSIPHDVFSIFTDADLKFPIIEGENGEPVEMSHGRFYAALYSKNRDYRKRAYEAFYKPFKEFSNTLNVLFNGNLKTNIITARTRKFNSALEASLNRNNIQVSVYNNLIKSVENNLQPMHRWAGLKKKLLNVDFIAPYDSYVTIFENHSEKKYSYDEAVKLVFNSLQLMGEEYLNPLRTAFENRWIDVYETQAKRSGAYSSGTTFGAHPYVLLNWTDLLNDVFTLAHEMGHNMHSYFTGQYQPYIYSNYSIFLAEVASTFNESLLHEYLIKNSSSKEEKLFLMEKYLNNVTATFYRQTMFAEFEKTVYEKTENGLSLSTSDLRIIYKELYQKYWGSAMFVTEDEEFAWARIPHFYYNFYVFQYATGFSASEALTTKVKTEGNRAVQKYLNFLKAGSSDYSINILRDAGIDMDSSEPIIATANKMNQILDEMELLLNI
ncbi:MAG: oligoendopeptidase F [Ignavibacteria bacterium]|jgi:oligoendopeptidase F|nr:oligoendopeptidase F [Ignavibacteria bacterium]